MKRIPIFLIALFIFNEGYTQAAFGPRAGISSSKISLDEDSNIREGDRQFGFHAGAFARFTLGFIYLQPELLFTSSGGEIEFSDDSQGVGQQIADLEYNKIDLPVLAGLRLGEIFRVNAGPTLSLLLNADAKSGGVTRDVKENYKDATVGYQAGVGVDLGNLILDLKYEGNLSKFSEDIELAGTRFDTDQRNTQLILSLGIKLFGE